MPNSVFLVGIGLKRMMAACASPSQYSPSFRPNIQTVALAPSNHFLSRSRAHPSRCLLPAFPPSSSSLSSSAFSDFAPSIQGQPIFSNAKLSSSSGVSFRWMSDRRLGVSVRASSIPEAAGDSSQSSTLVQTLELGLLFGTWYLFNIYFNIYNKQVLKVFPHPTTITSFHFLVGSVLILLMWGANLHKKPRFTYAQLLAVAPLVVTHTFGNLFTNMSIGKVAVSFTHTIKAMEPFFSVLFSAMFLGEMPTFLVVTSLVPVVGGVALASVSEASFNWAGFLSAMASNVTNQSRNVFSKKLMKEEEAMDNINLFSVITIMSFLVLTPVALFRDGVKVTPAYMQSAGLNIREIYVRSLIAGLCFHASQQVSYMILGKVSPVTHSVGNCVKRVVVIVTSVIFFRTPVSPINALGTGIALAGVFLYSRVKRIKPKKA